MDGVPDCGGVWRYERSRRRPGVGQGKGRGVTKPVLKRVRRRR